MNSVQQLFLKGKVLLQDHENPSLEAKLLLLKCARVSEEKFYSDSDFQLTSSQERCFFRMIRKRKEGVPVAYLIREKEFWSIPFRVSPGVLIPRPETELIVETVIKLSTGKEEIVVDIGTGCGNIAVSLSKELPHVVVIATDISRKALKAVRINCRLQNAKKVHIKKGPLFKPLEHIRLKERCDFIVSNPPYVSFEDWKRLDREIRDFEPKEALVAGATGLEMMKKIVEGAFQFLKPGGYLVFEIGYGQKEAVENFFGSGWREVKCMEDLSEIPRVFVAQKKQ